MEMLDVKGKEFFYNILDMDRIYPNEKFDNYTKEIVNYYGNITDVPEPIANAMVFSRNLDTETRTDLITILDHNISFKILCNPSITDILEQDVIDYCIQIYKDNSYISGYYQTFKPNIYASMSDKIANQLMYECEKNIISDQSFAFILNFVSDEKFVQKLYPLILNNKAFEAIASNRNLSEKIRIEALLESGSTSVRNLTENMKRILFNYYMEGIENIPNDTYPANKMLSFCSEPNRYLTPELEIEAMKRLGGVATQRLSFDYSPYLMVLAIRTTNSSTISMMHDLFYTKTDKKFIKPYQNQHISLEDRKELINKLFLYYQIDKSFFCSEEKMRFLTSVVELCNNYKGKNINELYDVIKSNLVAENIHLNTILVCKLLTLPDFNDFTFLDKSLIYKQSSVVSFLAYANKKLSQTNLSLEAKRQFLKTIAYISYVTETRSSISSNLEFNDEYKGLLYAVPIDPLSKKDYKVSNSNLKNILKEEKLSHKDFMTLSKILKKGSSIVSTPIQNKVLTGFKNFLNDCYKQQYRDMTKFANYTKEELIDVVREYNSKLLSASSKAEEFLITDSQYDKMTHAVKEMYNRGISNFPEITSDKLLEPILNFFYSAQNNETIKDLDNKNPER